MVSLSKQEVARRQLVTAINLFFDQGDSVSIYTLGQAAWEVLDSLRKHQGKIRFREGIERANSLSPKEVYKIATYGRNFFKHADKDPEVCLKEFHDELNDQVLMCASFDYTTISDSLPVELQLMKLWYFAAYPSKAPLEGAEEYLELSKDLFPNLHKETREKQKLAGREVLLFAKSNRVIISDPGTDTSPTGPI